MYMTFLHECSVFPGVAHRASASLRTYAGFFPCYMGKFPLSPETTNFSGVLDKWLANNRYAERSGLPSTCALIIAPVVPALKKQVISISYRIIFPNSAIYAQKFGATTPRTREDGPVKNEIFA
ncbi:MAG: hypothetical protein K2H64_05930 [Desulfovibrio sp.]|nr:hypothetical protein [Desulfovibrio sp.]MDE5832510.1 hypothetical protein [Desulfovibrio sp.]